MVFFVICLFECFCLFPFGARHMKITNYDRKEAPGGGQLCRWFRRGGGHPKQLKNENFEKDHSFLLFIRFQKKKLGTPADRPLGRSLSTNKINFPTKVYTFGLPCRTF